MDAPKLERELADHAIHPAFLFLSSNPGPDTFEEQVALHSIPRMAEELGGFAFLLPSRISKNSDRVLPVRVYAEALTYYHVAFESLPTKASLKVATLKKPAGNVRKFEVHAPSRLPGCSLPQ